MAAQAWINPKNSKFSHMQVDKELCERLPTILEPCFHGKRAYLSTQSVDANGNIKNRSWGITADNWSLQIDVYFRKNDELDDVLIMGNLSGESEVRSIAKILKDNGATWLKGINPEDAK